MNRASIWRILLKSVYWIVMVMNLESKEELLHIF